MSLLQLNVETNQSKVVANFAGKLPWSNVAHVWTKSEGSPSADGRYWCFMADTDPFNIRGVFTYDLQTQSVNGARSLRKPDEPRGGTTGVGTCRSRWSTCL